MRNLLVIMLATVLLAGGAASAQSRLPAPRNRPSTTATTNLTIPLAGGALGTIPGLGRVPGTIPTPISGAGGAIPGTIGSGTSIGVLGSIPDTMGTAATVAMAPVGAITTCGAAPGLVLDASSANPFSGALSAPPPPGATLPANPSFGSSLASGSCNPTTATQDAVEALGIATVIAPIPGLATITTPTYSDATLPIATTQAGASGQSPSIVVPTPPIASPCAVPTAVDPTMTAPPTMPTTPGC